MNSAEIFDVLMRTDPFEMLAEDVLKMLAEKTEVRTYPANTYVFKQGDASIDALYIIVSGLVELTVSNDRGEETVIGLKRQNDFFGETVVLSRQRYPGAARVKKRLTCCLVFREDLEKLIYSYPEFCGFFNTLLAERMRLLYEELVAEQSYMSSAGLSGIRASQFRKRVSEVMAYPAITCRTDDLVTAAAGIMAEKDINAVVALDRQNRPRGILTEKNLVRYLIARQTYPVETCRVENVMFSNLMEIQPQAFIGQALVAMMRSKNKHLIVMERGELVGIVSMVDLIRIQSVGTLTLAKDIESQPDLRGLSVVSHEIRDILGAMTEEKATVHEIFDVMSELHERLTRRVIQLSEEKMKLGGWGGPPVEYCWVNMGSAARYEQVFGTDQDNAIIYADPESENALVTDYFERLAALIVDGLARCGFGRCDHGMMATSATCRRSVKAWTRLVREWRGTCGDEDTWLFLSLADCRPIWGNMALAESFRRELFEAFSVCLDNSDPDASEDAPGYQPPITFLGTFITESRGIHKNEMNLKKTAIIPVVNAVRLLSIKYGIFESSTLGRLKCLVEGGGLSPKDGELFQHSFETLIRIQIAENMKKMKQGRLPDNYIDPYSLKKMQRMALKDALVGVSRLLKRIGEEFDNIWVKQFI
ncbi:hypothetical protein DENIS_3673 [Desulfonema ishimotonii]|uniref:CBS domain-containing protein n=2 Tax=Desulfonema ishimotonii TaxID=45657 RepID=A0A401G0H8_9BACT|nr:hypothetical protein DENIS_3673 [Desulfonema ishimotonii]